MSKIDFKKIFKKLKLAYLSLSIARQIVLIGVIIGIISLFLPWIQINDLELKNFNSFASLSGNVGYIIMFLFAFVTFCVLSNNYKERLKFYSDIDFKNHFFTIISGVFIIILSLVVVSFASGLDFFSQNIKYENGPIFCIISGILILVGGIFMRADFKKNNSEIILEEMAKNREKNKQEKENMKLPF